jgi:hypothetical protein
LSSIKKKTKYTMTRILWFRMNRLGFLLSVGRLSYFTTFLLCIKKRS